MAIEVNCALCFYAYSYLLASRRYASSFDCHSFTVSPGELSARDFPRNRSHSINMYIRRFVLRNLFTQLWELTGPKSVGQASKPETGRNNAAALRKNFSLLLETSVYAIKNVQLVRQGLPSFWRVIHLIYLKSLRLLNNLHNTQIIVCLNNLVLWPATLICYLRNCAMEGTVQAMWPNSTSQFNRGKCSPVR